LSPQRLEDPASGVRIIVSAVSSGAASLPSKSICASAFSYLQIVWSPKMLQSICHVKFFMSRVPLPFAVPASVVVAVTGQGLVAEAVVVAATPFGHCPAEQLAKLNLVMLPVPVVPLIVPSPVEDVQVHVDQVVLSVSVALKTAPGEFDTVALTLPL